MCGIAGVVSLTGDRVEEARIVKMRDVLAHRGPDGAGVWVGGPVGLGHRRLSIVDVAAGQQPMTNEDGTIHIVFNGEIYNHADLRPALEARGHRYRTRCDTETILHLYEEDGERAVERLHGMFAFAIWDGPRQRLLLGRDRLGIKPLYYANTGREIVFGSEIKALLAAGVKPETNDEVLSEFLATRYTAADRTFYKGIRRLQPGHTLTWSAEEGIRQRRYWQIPGPAEGPTRSLKVEAADLRERLRNAVRRHLMSDVPLGLFLSGGLDSSGLAALAAQLLQEPIKTFAVGFAEAEANELPYARLMANHIGAEHREVLVSPGEYFDALPQMIYQEDEPIAFPSSVPLYFVSRLARDHVKVVLTGEGADELFFGYERYRTTQWNHWLSRPYSAVVPRAARTALSRAIRSLPRRLRRFPERTFLALEPGVRSLFFENFSVFPPRTQHGLVRPELLQSDPYAVPLERFASGQGSLLDRLSQADLQTYLHELLMKQDQMSMAASIESRVPFLDDEIIEHVARLPSRMKVRGMQTKAVLRAAIQDLIPKEILTRRKMGFPVPLGRWFRGAHWPMVEEFVLGGRTRERGWFDPEATRKLADDHRRGTGEHGDRLWLLINLEIWQRIFIDGEEPARVMRAVGQRVGVSNADSVGEARWSLAAQHGRAAT